ncbi:MAG: acetyl-CoA carboxylase carboxyltransferase subunit alpha [Sedimentisphaerales bacterium]|nr:acetyl-CoA carboxylase carboxyltransferase subunit alpha [Sedimentisphaerales bacterium]
MTRTDHLNVAVANGTNGNGCLEFEKPLADLESQIRELQALQRSKGIDYSPEIRQLQSNLVKLTNKIYNNLSAWEIVQVARHPRRPLLMDYLNMMAKDFCQLHGDRCFGDDRAVVTGFGRIGREKVMIVGHNKGRTTKEKVECNFGCTHPEGYRKALGKMKLAEKFNLPIVCLIDTPGAYPGIGAEERGQAQAIAVNLMEMSQIRVPIVCVIIGEGGSGGALGIGVGDRVAMLQYAWYTVASPEACAAILWKDGAQAFQAAEALKLTAKDLLKINVIDQIIPEPLGGAHRNPHEASHHLENYLIKVIRDLRRYKVENLLENRYRKIRTVGEFNMKPRNGAGAGTIKSKPINEITTPSRRKTATAHPKSK